MAVFPSITDKATWQGYEITRAFDPAIRARSEAGYTKTRARTSRIPHKWKLNYEFLSFSEVNTLKSFEATVRVGSDIFTWTEPYSLTTYSVRLTDPIKYTPISQLYWRAEVQVEEI